MCVNLHCSKVTGPRMLLNSRRKIKFKVAWNCHITANYKINYTTCCCSCLLDNNSYLLFYLSFTGVEDRMSVIWEKGVVSVLAAEWCSSLLWFWLVKVVLLWGELLICIGWNCLFFLSGVREDGPLPFCCSYQHNSSQDIQHLSTKGNANTIQCTCAKQTLLQNSCWKKLWQITWLGAFASVIVVNCAFFQLSALWKNRSSCTSIYTRPFRDVKQYITNKSPKQHSNKMIWNILLFCDLHGACFLRDKMQLQVHVGPYVVALFITMQRFVSTKVKPFTRDIYKSLDYKLLIVSLCVKSDQWIVLQLSRQGMKIK